MRISPVFLTLVFLILKLTGVINWGWIWVFSPLWIFLGLLIAIFALLFVFIIIAALMKWAGEQLE
jgi:hypothetical protein